MARQRRKVNIDLELSNLTSNSSENLTFGIAYRRFAQYQTSRGKSDQTKRNYRYWLQRYCNYLAEDGQPTQIEDSTLLIKYITYNSIELYINHLSEDLQLAPNSINSFVRAIRVFCDFLNKTYKIENCAKNLEAVRVPEKDMYVCSQEELDTFYSGINTTDFIGLRFYTLCKILELTGCRLTECVNLDVNDIDFTTKEIVFKKTKNLRIRRVPMNTTLENVLRVYLQERTLELETNKLFVTESNTPLSVRTVSREFTRNADYTGVPISAHVMRRFFIRSCIRNNVNLVTLQRLIGHSDLNLLYKYLGKDDKAERAAVMMLNKKKNKRE